MFSLNLNQRHELAHGFNEELTIILNTAVLAARILGPEHPANDAMIQLQHSAVRCTELARKLLLT